MTLDEAIKIKLRTGEEFLHTDPDEIDEADRLSIEALIRVRNERINPGAYSHLPLPGEDTIVSSPGRY